MSDMSTGDAFPSYDVRSLVFDDDNLDVKDWQLESAIREKTHYKLLSPEPFEYTDCKPRYMLKNTDNKQKYYAYCVQVATRNSAVMQDMHTDFLYMLALGKRYAFLHGQYEDICLEQTADHLRVALV